MKYDTIFDQPEEGRPVAFKVGNGDMIQGVENPTVGMTTREVKQIY